MEYALVTIEHVSIGSVDVKVNRKLPIKIIIYQLFSGLSKDMSEVKVFCMKATKNQKLLLQQDTFEKKDIFDGEVLKIL